MKNPTVEELLDEVRKQQQSAATLIKQGTAPHLAIASLSNASRPLQTLSLEPVANFTRKTLERYQQRRKDQAMLLAGSRDFYLDKKEN